MSLLTFTFLLVFSILACVHSLLIELAQSTQSWPNHMFTNNWFAWLQPSAVCRLSICNSYHLKQFHNFIQQWSLNNGHRHCRSNCFLMDLFVSCVPRRGHWSIAIVPLIMGVHSWWSICSITRAYMCGSPNVFINFGSNCTVSSFACLSMHAKQLVPIWVQTFLLARSCQFSTR